MPSYHVTPWCLTRCHVMTGGLDLLMAFIAFACYYSAIQSHSKHERRCDAVHRFVLPANSSAICGTLHLGLITQREGLTIIGFGLHMRERTVTGVVPVAGGGGVQASAVLLHDNACDCDQSSRR